MTGRAGCGAYILHLTISKPLSLRIGALGIHDLAEGRYLYIGSARLGIASRCARHERLARDKTGKVRWHIDYLMVNPNCSLAGIDSLPGAEECRISRLIARRKGVTTPVPGFGASDCRSGCGAHLYRVGVISTSD